MIQRYERRLTGDAASFVFGQSIFQPLASRHPTTSKVSCNKNHIAYKSTRMSEDLLHVTSVVLD